MKKFLIVVGVLVGAILLLGLIFFAIIKYETSQMPSLKTEMVVEGVYAIQDDYTNMYLIKSGSKYVAIDTGENAEQLKQELNRLKIEMEDVVAVLLTLSDPDHIGGLELFPKATVYISNAEEQMINK